jgi:hypothetical protein
MSDKLRAFRDQMERGDEVMIVNHGPRPRRARVVEVLRAAVRVNYHDKPGAQETVLFKHVTRIEEETRESVSPPSVITTLARKRRILWSSPEADAPTIAAEPETATVPNTKPNTDDLTAWLDMGRDMASRMREQITELEESEKSLRLDAKQLEDAAEIASSECSELRRKLKALTDITGAKS